LIALGKSYFYDGWNCFDFVIVVGTIIFTILGEAVPSLSGVGTQTTILRTFRMLRVLRLVNRAKQLRIIFTTFVVTIPSLANVGGLMFILMFLFAILGINFFGLVKPLGAINDHANF